METRRTFSREFKLEAVRLVTERGVAVAQAAKDLDVHENVLRKWVRELREEPQEAYPGNGKQKAQDAEIARLRKEVAKLKMERDILKKGRGLLREGVDVKFGFVAKHRGAWPVNLMCEALGVSRGGFYAWLTRPRSQRSLSDEVLGAQVHQSFVRSDRTYGARRVWHDVLEQGQACGLHRIERLMREQALRARPRRRGLPKDRGTRSAVADNVLDRQFRADGPNQKWVADFTYIWTAEGWLYVAAVLDLYSRRIVGWSMQESMTSQLVVDALMMAVWRRGKTVALLHHSDQGSQYTSEHFQKLLDEQGITCSMSRAGEVWDNSAMESFFSSLKTERTARKVYRTRGQARSDVFDYIECFYNPTRRHSTLGYLSPVQFEKAQEA
ncbi:IS3 family transposase [Comamonas aquatica]|uniref:IS3 family transposase n=1 Tax=Comamonas aquatica TaxID=225991 RepID=UPI001B364590|nr:IS3 family transposase [Comamonas aquatica]QTX19698.1 IS3 family transposase [Comamonas aquatica]QTX20367.1 IS3 family transposase [Comamonas aquatica]QTX22065.1 IS3 family transposase [Comamonas aquatica]QTX22534.1 IS3 family transposase [Comamonas aquatica]QTX22553.1 IS3 family transposase [Comamonas aquatica]